jgi:hypothetical protein
MKKYYNYLSFLNAGSIVNRALALSAGLLCIGSVAFGQQVQPGIAPMSPPPTGFGIDGDLKAFFPSPGPYSDAGDWLPDANGDGGVLQANGDTITGQLKPFKAYHFKDSFTSGDDVFSGGEKKNTYIQNITWKNGNPSPAKCDINHFMMHIAKDNANDVWIVLSGDREEINGNSFISLQLLQKKLEQVSSPSKKFISAAPNSTGGRTPGDLQISAEFTGGGGNPNLYLERWELVGNVYKWVPRTYLPGDAMGAVNSSLITNNAYTMFGINTYQPNAFIEIAVNISDIIESVSGEECFGRISTLWVQTKTSQSETAALTDFVTPIQINLDISIDLTAADPTAQCGGSYDLEGAITSSKTGLTFEYYDEDPRTNQNATPINQIVDASGTYYIKAVSTTEALCNNVVAVNVSIGDVPARPVIALHAAELCGDYETPTIEILCPVVGTYTVKQPGEQPVTFNYTGSGSSEIGNLVGGKTFSITVKVGNCESDSTTCNNYTSNTCPVDTKKAPTVKPQSSLEKAEAKNLMAFPVPFSDKVTIKFTAEKAEKYVVNLYDMQGKLIKELKAGYSKAGEVIQFEMNGKALQGNVYVVRKISNSGVNTIKLLKEK